MTGQIEFRVPSADSLPDPIPSGIDPTELEITLTIAGVGHHRELTPRALARA